MRVLLYQSAKGLYASSGGYKSNLTVLRHLASRGHIVQQVVFAYEYEIQDFCKEQKLRGRKITIRRERLHIPCGLNGTKEIRTAHLTMPDGVRVVSLNSSDMDSVFPSKDMQALTRAYVEYILQEEPLPHSFLALLLGLSSIAVAFRPTHIMFNETLPLKLTSMMALPSHVRRAFVVHTAEQLPFGPFAGGISGGAISPREHELLQEVDGIWSVSKAIQDYAKVHGDLETEFIFHHPWNYLEEGTEKLPRHRHNFSKGKVLMVNPCSLKGSDILLPLVQRCPELDFIVVSSWGSIENPDLQESLKALPNVILQESTRDMESLWDRTTVLLMPSLWCEAWGLVVVEAQLRGIPVISSDAGAIPEAKLNIPYIIPVRKITGERDAKGYIIEEQDIDPWVDRLRGLMTDPVEYEWLSNTCRNETSDWVAGLHPGAHEDWLLGMMQE